MRNLAIGAMLVLVGCSRSSPSSTAPPSASSTSSSMIPSIPAGSGDYGVVLAHAARYKRGETTFAQLTELIVERKLRVHPLGDAYLLTPAPVPPPGVTFDPKMMPKDWEGTFGEVAMAYWLGELTRDEYDRLHRAAHPTCPK